MIVIKDFSLKLWNRTLIKNLNFSLKGGELTVLLGPNGVGKSTLMKTLAGLQNNAVKYCGNIYYDGTDIKQLSSGDLATLRSVMSQNVHVPFPMKVFDMIELGRVISGKHLTDFENRKLVNEIIERVGLSDFTDRNVQFLSGGELQRVQLARVLAQIWPLSNRKPVLFLDEPISSLDINFQHHILQLVKSLCKEFGISVIAVLHDINIAAQYGDRLLVLNKNANVSIGTAAEIVNEDLIEEVFGIQAFVQQHPSLNCPQIFTYAQYI